MESNPEEKDIVTIEIMTDIQLILAVLCESDMHRKVNLHVPHSVFHIWSVTLEMIPTIKQRLSWKSQRAVVFPRNCLDQRELRWSFIS